VLSSALTLAGGFGFRYVMVVAGHSSADDAQATFELARNDGAPSAPAATHNADPRLAAEG
jgi:hypothetical protein